MTTKRRPRGSKNGTVSVTFDLPAAVEADEIALCGDFNNWSTSATRLKRAKSGVWRVTIPLQTGQSYRYRYLLDGTHWENDWSADGYVRNPYGSDDSVVNVEQSQTSSKEDQTVRADTLTPELLHRMDAYWRAANYLSVGQIYLYDNPLLKQPLELSHVKPLVVGHWGTTPGQNFIYVHLNWVIKKYDLDMFYIAGPGHGGPALVGNTYLEGTYSEIYPDITQDEAGLKKLFTQFSFPGGISSHVAPTTPGSIHEGGELGYSLSHAFGAAFDNPDLIVACVVGDGEAETGPLATAWQSNKFLDPITDGAVLPILHLNGYKISNPTVLARIEHEELEQFLRGCGWTPHFVEGDEPEEMHQLMAGTLEEAIEDIRQIQSNARNRNDSTRPRWPMIVLKSPKGWTGPKFVDGLQVEGTFRAHQVPLLVDSDHPDHLKQLESWMKSYRAEELFDEDGRFMPELADLAPKGDRRMGANPHANGGMLLHDLRMPDFHLHAVSVPSPGAVAAQDTFVLGKFLRDVEMLNQDQRNFRLFGPDETLSNLLGAVFEATNRQWDGRMEGNDEFLAPAGRVLDAMLSEHQCEGWLEGYLLTGRHGLFNCYEAFVRIVDSMFSQHAKWLKVTSELPWRRKIASLNYLLASHVWQQDHNGFTHQDPGFLDHVINKKADIVRVYLPPDANCLLSVIDHCLRSRHGRQRRGGRQTRPPAVAEHGRRSCALHRRNRHLAMGQQRSGRRAGRGDGMLWRHPHAGDPGRRLHPSSASAGPENPGDQRRRPDEAAAQR
jgi:xylulose-5-phosphate/fructose-6-phosphate phosphoketolase